MKTRNTATPRVYIAATRQNDGKTTASIGLMAALHKRFDKLGFIKPVGQRYIEVAGERIDADAALMREVYGCDNELRDMSPVAVDRKFTRRYIDKPDPQQLEKRICDAFAHVAEGKDMVVIEGTGHAGVGSVFDLDNARVASMLHAPTVLIACGGIGRPFDEITLNRALFEKHGVNLVGVIVNKVKSNKLDEITSYLDRALDRVGLPLLGVIPSESKLQDPTIRHVLDTLRGELVNGETNLTNPVREIIVGAMTPHQALQYFKKDSLIVTPGDRDDLILTATSFTSAGAPDKGHTIAGLVLTGGVPPHDTVLDLIRRTAIPVVLARGDTYTVSSKLHDMMVKTKAEEKDKIRLIQEIYNEYLDVDRLLERLA